MEPITNHELHAVGAAGPNHALAFPDSDRHGFFAEYVNAGFEYASSRDQTSATAVEIEGSGYSLWVTPRTSFGLEGLLRRDSYEPDEERGGVRERTILGIAYWFPVSKGVAATVLLDVDRLEIDEVIGKPDEERWALHTMFNF